MNYLTEKNQQMKIKKIIKPLLVGMGVWVFRIALHVLLFIIVTLVLLIINNTVDVFAAAEQCEELFSKFNTFIYCAVLLICLTFIKLFYYKNINPVSVMNTNKTTALFIALAIGCICSAIINVVDMFMMNQTEQESVLDIFEYLTYLISVGILTPIFEEFIFRRIVFEGIRTEIGNTIAIIISSTAFFAMHGIGISTLYTLFMGVVFALIYEKCGGLRGSIYAHVGFNLTACLMELLL